MLITFDPSTFGKLGGQTSLKTNLIGDLTVQHALETVDGPRDKYIYINVDTMMKLIRNQLNCNIGHVLIVDARYGYEFNGGHLRGAVNIPSQVTFKEASVRLT